MEILESKKGNDELEVKQIGDQRWKTKAKLFGRKEIQSKTMKSHIMKCYHKVESIAENFR